MKTYKYDFSVLNHGRVAIESEAEPTRNEIIRAINGPMSAINRKEYLAINSIDNEIPKNATPEELRVCLYKRMAAEQERFVEQLKYKPPEDIIEAAYEKVMRDDILMTFEDDNFLSDKQIKELLGFDYPLSACYYEWMDSDCSHMDMLRDTISDFTDELIKKREQEKAKSHKKNDEPER